VFVYLPATHLRFHSEGLRTQACAAYAHQKQFTLSLELRFCGIRAVGAMVDNFFPHFPGTSGTLATALATNAARPSSKSGFVSLLDSTRYLLYGGAVVSLPLLSAFQGWSSTACVCMLRSVSCPAAVRDFATTWHPSPHLLLWSSRSDCGVYLPLQKRVSTPSPIDPVKSDPRPKSCFLALKVQKWYVASELPTY
jgi:hypothetical protein